MGKSELWEERKRRNAELERKSKMVYAVKPEHRAPGTIVTMPSGTKYEVIPSGWRRVK